MALMDTTALVFVSKPVATNVTKSRANVLVKPVSGGHTVMKHVLCLVKTSCATLYQESVSIVFLDIMDGIVQINALRVVETYVTRHLDFVNVRRDFIQPIVHYNVQKTVKTVTVCKKAEAVYHVFKGNMVIFVKKIVLEIVAIIVCKIPVFAGAVQRKSTVFIVTKPVPKTVKMKCVKETQENVANVKQGSWEKSV